MVVNGRTLKRANCKQRRPTASDLRDFLNFPAGEEPLDGAFGTNVKQFVARYALTPPQPSSLFVSAVLAGPQNISTWRISFRVGGEGAAGDEGPETPRDQPPTPTGSPPFFVDLDVVEEDAARSKAVYCDHCRVVGWSGHPVCAKRYHFVIRNSSNPNARTHRLCTQCCTQLDTLDTRCPTCKYEVTCDDLKDWVNYQLEDPTHLLHGVIHANGYGHLLRVNGLEGGSKRLTGCDIMDFWDRICKMLRVRNVTVMDISKKYGLDYRLLHSVATGRTWYGDWGYVFGAGSFGVTAEAYQKSVEALSSILLSVYFSHLKSERSRLHDTIALYWSITDRQLQTVGDLFRFLIEQVHKAHKQASEPRTMDYGESSTGMLCAWTTRDVRLLEDTMIRVLRAVGPGRWVSRQALRGATSKSSSPEMLDFCLKGLAGRYTEDGCSVVVARCNANSNAVEYRLEDVSQYPRRLTMAPHLGSSASCMPSAAQLVRDLQFLYEALLNPQTMHQYQPVSIRDAAISAATRILDCKKFVKNYEQGFLDECKARSLVIVRCHLDLLDQPKDYTSPPLELLILPAATSLLEFRMAIQKAYQDTYLLFRKFELVHVLELRNLKEHEEKKADMKLLFDDSGFVRVRGRCMGLQNLGQFRKERGLESWTVDCICGATDDDGERMVACDSCGVWRHTRCLGIKDTESSPKKLVCWECNNNVIPACPRGLPRATGGKRVRESATTWGSRDQNFSCGGLDEEDSRTGLAKKSRKGKGSSTMGDVATSYTMGGLTGKQGKFMISMPNVSEEEEYSDGSVLTEEGIGKSTLPKEHPQSPPTPSGGGSSGDKCTEVSGRCIDDAVNLVIDLPSQMTMSRVGRFITSVGG